MALSFHPIWLILLVPVYRWLVYHAKLQFVCRYSGAYEKYISEDSEQLLLLHGRHRIRRYAQEAGLDFAIPFVELLGAGHVVKGAMPPLFNPLARRYEAVVMNGQALEMMVGYFRDQRNQSLNPMYWIDLILHLPLRLLPVLERLPADLQKLTNVLMWLGALAVAYYTGGVEAVISFVKEGEFR